MAVAERLHRLEKLRTQVAIPALGLDRLGDEAGDVVWMCLEERRGLPQGDRLRGFDLAKVLRQWEGDRRGRDTRPVELREPIDFQPVGVGERDGVAAPSVKRVPKVHHTRTELGRTPGRLVAP